MSSLLLLITSYLILITLSDEHSMNGTVYFDETDKTYSVKLGIVDCQNGIVCGYFNDSLNHTVCMLYGYMLCYVCIILKYIIISYI